MDSEKIPAAASSNATWWPSPLPFVTEAWIQASTTPAVPTDAEQQQQALALSDTLIEELRAADVIVLGVPMHNFSIPASLKAWIDLITRAGKTFQLRRARGRKGLIPEGKQVLAIVSRGGSVCRGHAGICGRLPGPLPAPHAELHRTEGCLTVVDADRQADGAEDAAQQSVDNADKQALRAGRRL
jgi:hypothetical protein